jgi:hypothetical protein
MTSQELRKAVDECRNLIERLNQFHETLAQCGVQVEFDISTPAVICISGGCQVKRVKISATYSQRF